MTISQLLDLTEKICGKCPHYKDKDDAFCLKCGKNERITDVFNGEERKLTHHQLCELGARWIVNESHFGGYDWRILIEPGQREELPDVFAFTRNCSVLIECKASRSDFLADKRKPFRQDPQKGIGMRRFYLVNDGVATQDEMPDGWQLLIAYDKNTILMPTNYVPPMSLEEDKKWFFHVRNATNEVELMWSWEYRRQHKCLPVFPTDRPDTIHPGFWQQKGWLEKNIRMKNVSFTKE